MTEIGESILNFAPTAGYDGIAPVYRAMEIAAFGTALRRLRECHIDRFTESRNALVLGDGDGRFVEVFAMHNPECRITSIDSSPAMVRLARHRVRRSTRLQGSDAGGRIRWIVADATRMEFSADTYDLVVTQFFLDNFTQSTVDALIPAVATSVTVGGHWLYSDFATPNPARPWVWRNRIWLYTLYRFFRVCCGIEANMLANAKGAIHAAGMRPISEIRMLHGLLESAAFRKVS